MRSLTSSGSNISSGSKFQDELLYITDCPFNLDEIAFPLDPLVFHCIFVKNPQVTFDPLESCDISDSADCETQPVFESKCLCLALPLAA